MKASTKDQAPGKFHEVKGKGKETERHLTNNPDLETDGTAEKLAGNMQDKIGQGEKVLGT